MKKITTIAVGLLLGIFSTSLPLHAFYKDVNENTPHFQAIKSLYNQDLLEEKNNFQPDKLVTKSELIRQILNYTQIELSKKLDIPYSDLTKRHSDAEYIQTALDYQFIKFSSDQQNFQPKLTITKHYALTKVFQALGIGMDPFFDRNKLHFNDIKSFSPMAIVAFKAQEIGIFEEANSQEYNAYKRITRAELANYLYLTQKHLQKQGNGPQQPPRIEFKIESALQTPKTKQGLYNDPTFPIFLDVWDNLHDDYYHKEQLDNTELIQGAISGMVEQADDSYTVYQEPQEADNFLSTINGKFEGVGMSIETVDNQVIVISPLKNSPAEKAGLKPNDIIIAVDGEEVAGLDSGGVAAKIRGPANTDVVITVKRAGKILDFTVTRASIEISSAFAEMLYKGTTKIGYISIIQFNNESFHTFREEAQKLLDEGAAGLIIDLRNNPGGYLNVSVNFISLFFEKEKVAVIVRNSDGIEKVIKTTGNGFLDGVKTTVLINEGSASASEILAGALQDYKAAKIIGTNSFGKGTVQDVVQYKDGSIFKYTTAIWLTPLNQNINEVGLKPDRYIENKDDGIDRQLQRAIEGF
jgi:C-terminal peptidase prc